MKTHFGDLKGQTYLLQIQQWMQLILVLVRTQERQMLMPRDATVVSLNAFDESIITFPVTCLLQYAIIENVTIYPQ